MSSEIVIRAASVSKCYALYDTPRDRLKQFVLPRLQQAARLTPRRYFKEFWSLCDVSFELYRGQTLGVVGRNGAGKSTLLQILCGTLAPTSGQVEVRGRVAALLELGAGFNPEFTGRENVFMAARLFGLEESQILARFESIAAFADIGEFLEQPVKTYSSGMYVRLAFAVITHVDPDILVIDEALAVGDAYFSQKCMRYLRDFKERGTLLFVSHDASAVVSLCDRAIWLDKGRLIEAGTAKHVMQSYLEDLYGTTQQTRLPDDVQAQARKVARHEEALRNDDALFPAFYEQESESSGRRFGTGQATITAVTLISANGDAIRCVNGGEMVTLRVSGRTASAITRPIVGFIVKDRLGQHLFGENTYQHSCERGNAVSAQSDFVAEFEFRMPTLPRGEYSIAAAIAEGTQQEHVVHEWKHEALLFQSHSTSVSTGLVGIPMKSVKMYAGSSTNNVIAQL